MNVNCASNDMNIDRHVPVPVTVPYSVFFELPCAEAAGHKHMRAMNAKRIREREEVMRRDLARDGRR
jgi:hypothetical protein